jgi:hypothetical protein
MSAEFIIFPTFGRLRYLGENCYEELQVGFKVLSAVTMKVIALRNVTPCNFVDRYQRFGGTYFSL